MELHVTAPDEAAFTEIERKWLVDPDLSTQVTVKSFCRVFNYYVKSDALPTELRLRKLIRFADTHHDLRSIGDVACSDRHFYIDFKSSKPGIERMETSISVNLPEWHSVLSMHADCLGLVVKDCYRIDLGNGQTLELYKFLNRDTFWMAEVELQEASDKVDLPDWLNVSKEVTDDPSYYGYNLALPISYEQVVKFTEDNRPLA